jgi:hypothetical protein
MKMKEQEVTKLEFLLMCNDNIVVQRFFNVKGFNKNAHKSEEFYDFIKTFCNELKYDLKMRSVVYMLENRYEITENPEVLNTSITEGQENFNLYIKVENMTICQRSFDAKVYPPKVRYTVDLRPKLKQVLTDLTDIFSGKKFNYFYPQFIQN